MRSLTTAAVLLACAAAAHADPVTVTVYVFNYDYSQVNPNPPFPPDAPPDDPVIHVGDTIRWQRLSGFHNVVSCSGMAEQFQSPTLSLGNQVYTHTFTHVGRFWYFCSFHGFDNGDGTAGGMSGYIDVIPAPCLADVGTAGGVPGQDGLLNNNDFVVFIDWFFAGNTASDIGTTGGVPGVDGAFDNNDFVVYIDRFFAGCA